MRRPSTDSIHKSRVYITKVNDFVVIPERHEIITVAWVSWIPPSIVDRASSN